MDELRRFPRRVIPVEYHGRDSQGAGELCFEGADLSPGGCFLKADLLLETGELLSLEFRVPGIPRLMKAEARVAWVRRFPESSQPSGMGVEFLAMSVQDREVLSGYLAR